MVLLDSILNKLSQQRSEQLGLSEQFELFCFDQILKDYDLSVDETDLGWVDGSNDGGIDGFYTFIDGRIATSSITGSDYRRYPEIEVVIITCKHKDTFTQAAINNIITSVAELFDLSKDQDEITSTFNDDLLHSREIFREAYIELADKNPKLKIRFVYASRGDSNKVAVNVKSRANLLVSKTLEVFSSSNTKFEFIGAKELLDLYRKAKIFSLRLKFIESAISRSNNSYVILSRLDNFYNFICDENGKLRRYLFDSNVRDFLPGSLVNQDIAETLGKFDTKDSADFWLLNNGVTILTSNASMVGKEMSLENIQIVNGLQTTETIYNHFTENGGKTDDRALLVKIIVAKDENLRDRIIKATNNQNKVDLSTLKATDKIQKDIEQVLLEKEWYYDRRKNYYKNLGKPQERIVTVPYMAQAVLALCLKKLEAAGKSKPSYLSSERTFTKLFNENWPIKVYVTIVELRKKFETKLIGHKFENNKLNINRRGVGLMFAYVYVVSKLKQLEYTPDELLQFENTEISNEDLNRVWEILTEAHAYYIQTTGHERVKRPHRNKKFIEIVELTLSSKFSSQQ